MRSFSKQKEIYISHPVTAKPCHPSPRKGLLIRILPLCYPSGKVFVCAMFGEMILFLLWGAKQCSAVYLAPGKGF